MTVIPERTFKKSRTAFRYLENKGFVGVILCSHLDGRFVEAYRCRENAPRERIRLVSRAALKQRNIDLSALTYRTYRPGDFSLAHSMNYSYIEDCEWHPEYNIENCPFCLDVAEVISCTECGGRIDQNECTCVSCSFCGNTPCTCCDICGMKPCICERCVDCNQIPCACSMCDYCGGKYCSGTCQSGSGSGSGSGGSGSGSGGGGGSGDNTPKCPYGVCSGNPCKCCIKCRGVCKCSGCHKNPCECCPGEQCRFCQGFIPETGPQGRAVSDCLVCLCWNEKTHHSIIDEFAKKAGLDKTWIDTLKKASNECDRLLNQRSSEAYLHAMSTDRNLSAAEAQKRFEEHLMEQFNSFVKDGKIEALGKALHGITDSFCPSHKGFQYVSLVSLEIIEHSKWDKGENSPGAMSDAIDASADIVHILKERKADSAQRALDYWRIAYQKNLKN